MHVSCRKYIVEKEQDIELQFDVWHVSKSVKKLTKLAKKKSCALLGEWTRSICNHLWWCSSTCGGDVELLREKWLSILFHATNQHEFPGKKYTKCAHETYSVEKQMAKKWFTVGTQAYEALDKKIVKDIAYLNKFSHTGNLEVYHSLRNKYAPKRFHFSYEGMLKRSQLAILDWNTRGVNHSNKSRTPDEKIPKKSHKSHKS